MFIFHNILYLESKATIAYLLFVFYATSDCFEYLYIFQIC